MLINPQVLIGGQGEPHFTGRVGVGWRHLIWIAECSLCVQRLQLRGSFWNEHAFWSEVCPGDCRRWFWACENFDWVASMSEYDQLRSILSAVPLRHAIVDNTVLVQAGTRVEFRDGNVERVR